ncbi:hypothetical protein JXA56_02530 [Candidatus Micrarchaeota archaeon]|nr:hypothetical protein [Candidatus Micrarchaeota archaeon]
MTDFELITPEEYSKRQAGTARKYSMFVVVLDPEKSELARILDVKVPGPYYAVKSK